MSDRPTPEVPSVTRDGFSDPTLRTLREHTGQTEIDAPEPRIGGRTDIGLQRERNQDQFLVTELDRTLRIVGSSFEVPDGSSVVSRERNYLLCVADGIGSHARSELASAVAIDALAYHALSILPWLPGTTRPSQEVLESFSEGLRDAVIDAQTHLRKVAVRKNLGDNVGTTLTVAYVVWPALYIVHVGDSRGYLMRGDTLQRLTRDHTMAEALKERGFPDTHPRFGHILTNAIGGGDADVSVDFTAAELEPGDILLLCSDGLSGQVSEDVIKEKLTGLRRGGTPDSVSAELIQLANDAGGDDNCTVVIGHF
ncbi:MAG: serine/threonine-protein phosphatase [Deltaproteobacteria bacterium]|nr:serine/threonine-protein phosphatase [Deltaproteobacteria bacterium]